MRIHVGLGGETILIFESTSIPSVGSILLIDNHDWRKSYRVMRHTWVMSKYSTHGEQANLSYVYVDVGEFCD